MWFPERGLHVSWSFWLLILLAAIVSPLTIVLSILLAAALHECGHLLALRAFHVPIEGVRLSAFGAVLHARGAQRLSYGRELVVTLAGCGMNLVCGVLTAWFSLHYVWVEGFVFAGAHILLCAFNLLPIPPLDGFHVVNDLLFKGRLNISGKAFRFAQIGLLLLLFSTNFIGRWVGAAIYAVQGAILPLLLSVFPV